MKHKIAFSFVDGKTLFFEATHNELLLDAALRNGLNIPMDCREGVCATCRGQCDSGNYVQEYVDEDALSEADLAARQILACQTRVLSDATFSFDFASTQCHAAGPDRLQARVHSVRQVSAAAAILQLELEDGAARLDFLPGQYARLRVPGSDEWRAYSFANSPNAQNRLQFLIRLLPDGAMSNYIRERCAPGQTLELEAPLGSFYLREIERPLVMVAGGTGLSAFLGMLDELAESGRCGQPIRLYYGVNQEADLCEAARLEGYRTRLADFDYQTVISQPGENWQGPRGYIPEHLPRTFFENHASDIYLCGPPPMVEAVRGWFQTQNLDNQRMFFERFSDSRRVQ